VADTPPTVGAGATDAVAIGDGVPSAALTAEGSGTADVGASPDASDRRIPLTTRYPPMAAPTTRFGLNV
jgi:hypothetical protein